MQKPVLFINSHPIQYFAPMYKYMNEHGVETSCWYCTDASVKGSFDKQFGVEVKWDIPLLQGYQYKFFKNYSWKPSHFKGFFGLINLGMFRALKTIPKSVIIVHGWHYVSLLGVLVLGKRYGHQVGLRSDVPLSHERLKKGWKQKIKNFALRHFLFPRISYFMYIGEQNRLFYKSLGAKDEQLIRCPYAVDNDRFKQDYLDLKPEVPAIKAEMGIPADAQTIIFSAKYIAKKRPLDILKAFAALKNENIWLIMVGEGELRGEMEDFIRKNEVKNVLLTGFVNQSKISRYYAIGDLFVMCSGLGENWGLSVNEAMNFDVPLVLSDLSGCADDLVKEGVNGYVFKTGDVNGLATCLKKVLIDKKLGYSTSSLEIVDRYSYRSIVEHIKPIL